MILQKILGQSAFWIVNKEIAKNIGIEPAVLLADLIDKHSYFETRNELDDDGYFYNTSENIESSTSLNYHAQKRCLKTLNDVGYVETKLKGIPAKLHFKVVENKILIFLNTGIQTNVKQEKEIVETNNNKSNNNKNDNKEISLFQESEPTLFEEIDLPTIPNDVIKYLNEKRGGQGFKLTNGNLTPIKARIKEGFKIDDFKKVIDAAIIKWSNDEKMKKYIRPETLFGNKMDSYLVESTDIIQNSTLTTGSNNFVFAPSDEPNLK